MEVEDNNIELNVGGNALLEALLELKQRATDNAEDSDSKQTEMLPQLPHLKFVSITFLRLC